MAFEENEDKNYHLEELSGSDFEVVEGEPDITGWDVVNEQGQKIGEVDDLLFDKDSRQVRYIIVDLDENELDLDTNKKVLVPIGVADLQQDDDDDLNDDTDTDADFRGGDTIEHPVHADAEETHTATDDIEDDDDDDDDEDYYEVVIIPNITVAQLSALPAYEKRNLTPDVESSIRSIFDTSYTTGTAYDRDTFYNHGHFDEDKFFNRESLPLTGGITAQEEEQTAAKWGDEPGLGNETVDNVIIVRDEQDVPENLIENEPRLSGENDDTKPNDEDRKYPL